MFTRNRVIMSHNIKTPLTSISRAVGNILQLKYDQLIKSLFSNGEQGFFYDPNDLSTMFQDSAGTIPVTAAGQHVGLILDKAKGVALGSEKVVNPDFDSDTAWTKAASVTISNGSAIFNGTIGNPVLSQNVGITPGKWYELTINVAEATAGVITLRIYGTGGNDVILSANTVGVYKVRALARSDATGLIGFSALLTSMKLSSVSVKELAGNHAYQTTSASRPILRKNALTGANYLEFDGTDDFLQTGNINFTATDKVSLFAGVNKLSTTTGILYELSSNSPVSNGSFYMATPVTTGTLGLDGFSFRGTSSVNKTYLTTLTGPVLYTVQGDIGNKSLALRTNGVLRASTVADTGVGTLGNYPLFIGRRDGTSVSFNGHLYSLIGVGKLTTDSETAAIEKELAKRIGVTL